MFVKRNLDITGERKHGIRIDLVKYSDASKAKAKCMRRASYLQWRPAISFMNPINNGNMLFD